LDLGCIEETLDGLGRRAASPKLLLSITQRLRKWAGERRRLDTSDVLSITS
jgi:hypothetical protein